MNTLSRQRTNLERTPSSDAVMRESPGRESIDLEGINWRAFEYYPALGKVKEYTELHYSNGTSLEVAAKVAGMESTYFSSFFRQKVGVRFVDWMRYLRISRAMALFATRHYQVTEVAFEVGFHDLRTFERAFRRITNMTPREFRKMCRPA